jgi:hypothetical protein
VEPLHHPTPSTSPARISGHPPTPHSLRAGHTREKEIGIRKERPKLKHVKHPNTIRLLGKRSNIQGKRTNNTIRIPKIQDMSYNIDVFKTMIITELYFRE